MLNFYQGFLPSTAQVLAPLTDTLKGPNKSFLLSSVLHPAYGRTKLLIASVPSLFTLNIVPLYHLWLMCPTLT